MFANVFCNSGEFTVDKDGGQPRGLCDRHEFSSTIKNDFHFNKMFTNSADKIYKSMQTETA